MSHFTAQVEHFGNADAFRAHLNRHNPSVAPWVKGIVLHHTWLPTIETWRGRPTLQGIQNYYTGLGWTAGPHLFIVAGSKDPSDDGIWQLTPLNIPGVHAKSYNSTHWGIEVVGNYDIAPWSDKTATLVYETMHALFRWKNLSVNNSTLLGHRETGSPKTCPGKRIDMSSVRDRLTHLLQEDKM